MAVVDFNTLNFVASVTERDIDYLVLEELQVSASFRDWLSSRVFELPLLRAHVGAWHSVVDAVHGESDLIFMFEADDGSTKAILIENKISASAQPDQGKRYTLRGEKGKEQDIWQEYRTCLIAPRRYLAAQLESYDCYVSYEEIMAFFTATRSDSIRSAYRATLMLEAIKQDRRGYRPIVDEKMTAFAEAYWQYAHQKFPCLAVPPPKPRPAGNTWISFSPADLPKSIDFVHQLTAGFIKVFFKQKGNDYEAIQQKYEVLASLIPTLSIERAGKSVSISVQVKSVDPSKEPFEQVRENVDAALQVANQLLDQLVARKFAY